MKNIKISEVLALLDEGKSREEIAEHYGISMPDCRRLFKHEKLKGKKAKKQPSFSITDDTEEGIDELTNPLAEAIASDEEIEEEQHDIAAEVASIHQEESESANWENA